jgi:transcription initiation factor TFIIIB Brf1 subunit/transcription initiation factor TFIIB
MSKCNVCRGSNVYLDVKEGNLTCRSCGEVLEHRIIDESDETRNFAKDHSVQGGETARRVANIANNPFLSDSGLGTVIEFPQG